MDSRTLLEQAVFQLTPTRTRCDLLVVSRDGKREKIASGLVAPFLTHLRSARDQIPKGGYSFSLRPPSPPTSGGDFGLLGWFTKGVMKKFVRFVETPEIIERVVTIEKEIVEIDEEIGRTLVPSFLNHPEVFLSFFKIFVYFGNFARTELKYFLFYLYRYRHYLGRIPSMLFLLVYSINYWCYFLYNLTKTCRKSKIWVFA